MSRSAGATASRPPPRCPGRSADSSVRPFLNGAGKTTTLKMLSGLLYPAAGEALVLGHVPSRRQRDFLRRIALVMGNRNQLQWDLPALDSFELNRAISRIPHGQFRETRDELVELLDVGDLVRKPVRNLSLDVRAGCRDEPPTPEDDFVVFLARKR